MLWVPGMTGIDMFDYSTHVAGSQTRSSSVHSYDRYHLLTIASLAETEARNTSQVQGGTLTLALATSTSAGDAKTTHVSRPITNQL